MRLLKNIFFTNLFFYFLIGFATFFTVAFFVHWLLMPAKIILFLFFIALIWDVIYLFGKKNALKISRQYPDKLSNGDYNDFSISVESLYPTAVSIRVLEEIPIQFQHRDFEVIKKIIPFQPEIIDYQLRPVKRGIYNFGKCVVLVKYLGFIERRITLDESLELPCYPSFIQLRKYLLMATTNRLDEMGVKRIRKIGSTLEFEHIREYTRGDEPRFINWKATAKTRQLMVNQYEDERSQPIYSFIDLGRSMRMPFEGLTLLDYAINSTLVLSNVTILKDDKAGLVTFSKNVDNHIVAEKRNSQMQLISEALYKITTTFGEPEFGRLYAYAKRKINQRALIFLYTNFETLDALYRQLPYLKLLSKSHILVVIVFKNTELTTLASTKVKKSFDIYNQIIAEKFNYEKQLIIQELQAHGIQTIFTTPENLTVNSINKYLEIKARGLI